MSWKFVQGLTQMYLANHNSLLGLAIVQYELPAIEAQKLRLKLKYLIPLENEETSRSQYSNEPAS
ncbi:MAG: hypothetical protein CL912_20545 [Deltaproteobacteria bacterium]|nr:hypothetical protein [Deltaproteobacteria bacterium]